MKIARPPRAIDIEEIADWQDEVERSINGLIPSILDYEGDDTTRWQKAIDSIPASGGTLEVPTRTYEIEDTLVFRSLTSFRVVGTSFSSNTSSTIGPVLKWNGTAGETVVLVDGCRDGSLENLVIVSGATNYGVAIDWDKISGTQTSTHMNFKHVTAVIPSAGTGWRVSNVADANHENGFWFDCYAIGPGTATGSGLSAGTAGTSIGLRIRATNAMNHRWNFGGAALLATCFQLDDTIATKSTPAGALRVRDCDAGNCDVFLKLGAAQRWPVSVEGGSVEFANQLISSNDANNSEAGVVSFRDVRCAAPATMTDPYILYRNLGILNLDGCNFNANGYDADFKIKCGHSYPGYTTVSAVGCVFPNATPFVGSAGLSVRVKNLGNHANYNDGYDARPYQPVYTAADTTPSVIAVCDVFVIANTGAVTITDFDDGYDGQELTLKFSDANTTIQDSASIQLAGGANFVGSADDTLTLIRSGAVWYEKGRSVN